MKYPRIKFILSAFSVYAILLNLPTLHAQAATETVEIDDYTYTITDGTVVLSGYDGIETDVIIPTSIDYEGQVYQIRTIGEFAFEGNQHMQTLVIPEEIVKLERGAFKNCTFLRSITINGDLGDCNDRSLSTDRLFQEAAYPWYSVFYNAGANASALAVTFGEGVTRIPAYLFATAATETDNDFAHITSVNLPTTMTEIGEYAFYNCHDLTEVYYSGTDRDWEIILVGESNERLIDAYTKEEPAVPATEDVTDQAELSETVDIDENAGSNATGFAEIIGFLLSYIERIQSQIVEIIRAFIQ